MSTLLKQFCALAMLLGLTACNTMRGVGEDISAMGRYISSSTGTAPSHSTPSHTGTGF
jgi:predicted small secreted protein